jgi:3-hydroxyacyl-CoA dehydrogenase
MTQIAILGAGLIGSSWAALFLAHGHDVALADPRSDAADTAYPAIASAWAGLAQIKPLGPLPADRLRWHSDIASACAGADFVQECGPDRLAVKQAMLTKAEAALDPAVIIASSTSSLMPSDIQAGMGHPGRLLVAHPMNPPHLVPLVELVAGAATAPETVARAQAFYDAMGRVTVVAQREVPGHIANRLTSALYREAVHMVAEGIATVADIDKAVAWGPGLRWALMGPHLIYHLGGGAGGYRGYLDHLGPTQAARWQALGQPQMDAATIEALIAGLQDELAALGDPDRATLERARDDGLVALLRLKAGLSLTPRDG